MLIEINEFLGTNWPPKNIRNRWDMVEHYREYYDNSLFKIESDSSIYKNYRSQGVAVPLPKVLARTSANLLFAEEMSTVPNTEDEDLLSRLEEIKTKNNLQARSKEAAETASAEGGVYIAAFLDPTKKKGQEVPLITYYSEDQVIPKFDADGDLESAITFTTLKRNNPYGATWYYRLVEIWNIGRIDYKLFQGNKHSLGKEVPLTDHNDTKDLPEYIEYSGIDELNIEYIPNIKNLSSNYGRSDFEGMETLFLSLDESFELTQEVLRTMVPHLFIDEELLDEENSFQKGSNIVSVSKLDGETSDKPIIEATQHRFESDQYIAWQRQLLETALLSVGTSPAALGLDIDGGLASGTALKIKMNNTLNQIAGKAQFFESGIAKILKIAMMIDQLEITDGENTKLAHAYNVDLNEVNISVSLGDGVPEDDPNLNEIAAAFQAGIISRFTAIKMQHSDWTDEQVLAEEARIEASIQANGASGLLSSLVL